MKIAIIVCTFPPYRGGIGNAAYNEAGELAKLGHEITVFCPRYQKEQVAAENIEGIKVRRLTPLIKFGNAALLLQLFWHLNNFEVFYLHYPFFGGAELAWLYKILHSKKKLVIRYHMDVVGSGVLGLIFKFHCRYLAPLIIKSADKVIFSSMNYAESSDIKELVRQSQDKFIAIPFGVNQKVFKPRAKDDLLLDELDIRSDERVALLVAALDKAHYFKGVDCLLQAFNLLKDRSHRLIIVGAGDLKSSYEATAKNLGIADKVIFVGEVSGADLSNYYNLADVLVLPSIDKSEAFGLVLIEAMACAKPVIASNLAGVRSLVDDGVNGFLVQPGNIGELSNRLDYLLSQPEVASRLGENGRRMAEERYNWEAVARAVDGLLKN